MPKYSPIPSCIYLCNKSQGISTVEFADELRKYLLP